MRAFVLSEVPNAHVSSSVAAYEFALVGMDNNVVHRDAVGIVALYIAAPSVPDFDCAVFR